MTVELFAFNAILQNLNNSTTAAAAAPTLLASAQLQVKQEMLTDSSDLLSRRVDMNSSAYTFCLPYFAQQEVQVPIAASAGLQSVNLTGFRAGEVKNIVLWLTRTATDSANPATGTYNPLLWYALTNVTLFYNGEVFSRFDSNTGQLWNLSTNEKSSSFSMINWTQANPSLQATNPSVWTECPFSQVCLPTDRDATLIHGKPKRWACAAAA